MKLIELLEEFYICKSCHYLARLGKVTRDNPRSVLRLCYECKKELVGFLPMLQQILEKKDEEVRTNGDRELGMEY